MTERDLERAYREYRQLEAPSPQEQDLVWARVVERIAEGETGPPVASERPSGRSRRFVLPLALATAAACVWVMRSSLNVVQLSEFGQREVDASAQSIRRDPEARDQAALRRPKPAAESRRRSDVSLPTRLTEPEPEPEPVLGPKLESPDPPRRVRRPVREIDERKPSVASLRAELALMQRARQALARGLSVEALSLLERHEREFPTGSLRPEREVLVVRALCSMSKGAQARERARRFLRAHPDSPWADRLRAACPSSASVGDPG